MAAYGTMEAVEPATGPRPSPQRVRALVALVAALSLCASVAVGMHSLGPVALWGGSDGGSPTPGNVARRSQLAGFEPAKLYKDPPQTDFDHENRIDNYGCMFSDCDGAAKPLLPTGLSHALLLLLLPFCPCPVCRAEGLRLASRGRVC
jgi:hypothetical protein